MMQRKTANEYYNIKDRHEQVPIIRKHVSITGLIHTCIQKSNWNI